MTEIEVPEVQKQEVRELSSSQRRILGVLIEKALTTPEYYPLTLKAIATGCNQKSNRDPVVNFKEDFVETQLDSLRQLGLVGLVQTEGGRTARYRHYVRRQYSFTEPQIAILTELLLRGRQTLGELRTRASRMVPIDDLDTLRTELSALMVSGYVRSSGSLERRGVEVDHTFYRENEVRPFAAPAGDSDQDDDTPASDRPASAPRAAAAAPQIQAELDDLTARHRDLESEVESLKATVASLESRVEQLCRDLGV